MAKGTTSKKTTRRLVAGKTAVASDSGVAKNLAVSEALIAERAYLIYLQEGRPDGRHLDHWTRAESELRG